MGIIPSKTFYVYILLRPNNAPFYVGKGKGDRITHHELEAKRGHTCHKCSVIRKIWSNGGEVLKQVVFETDDESEALAQECAFIARIGRANLTNRTDGGEGMTGYKHSLEARAAITRSNTGRPFPEDAKKRMSEARRGVKLSEEHRRNIGVSSKGHVTTEEQKAKLRASNIGKSHGGGWKLSEETRAKMSATQSKANNARNRVYTDEQRQALSERGKGRLHTPEIKAKIGMAHKGKVITEETRQHMIEGQQRRRQRAKDGE